MKEHGPWKIRATRQIHQDPWVTVTQDDVLRPDGQPGTYTVVRVLFGVSVLAVDDDGYAYLTEEFRYAVGRSSLEVASGGCDEGEEPLATAQRELREELGIEASEWTPLGFVDPFTSMLLSPTHLFLARGLRFGEPSHESTEVIRRVRMPLAEAVTAVLDGHITHAPSCVLILKAAHRLAAPVSGRG
jgi:ADP-ribose pyrophosphatase